MTLSTLKLVLTSFLATACLAASGHAATTASLTVGGSTGPFAFSDSITVRFNGFSETVHTDTTSTANSVASAFAAAFSRDYLKSGLCAAASGNVINFKIKTGAFGPVSVNDTWGDFFFIPSGLPTPPVLNAGGPYTGTAGIPITLNGSTTPNPSGAPLSYYWSSSPAQFTSSNQTPTVTFAYPGTYTLYFSASNAYDEGGTASTIAIIAKAPPLVDVPITGKVLSGTRPIAGARVLLLAVGTRGYGRGADSLLSPTRVAYDESFGPSAVTAADGTFDLSGDYTCSPGQMLYVETRGGDAGFGPNLHTDLVAPVGRCPDPSSSGISVLVNEVTTVASAYALAAYADNSASLGENALLLSSSGTPLAATNLANAFANIQNLADLSTGTALATTPAGNGIVPQAEINTLANVLASCVQSDGTGSPCSSLIAAATPRNSYPPLDTAGAAISIALHPGSQPSTLYSLSVSSSPPYLPILTAAPTDWTLGLTYQTSGDRSTDIAIDAQGNAWVANWTTISERNNWNVTKLSPLGAVLSGPVGFTGGGLRSPGKIAIDPSGNVWLTNLATVNWLTEFSSSGVPITGPTGYPTPSPSPSGLAIDLLGNVWTGQGTNLTEYNNSGTLILTTAGPWQVTDVSVDPLGNVWTAGSNADSGIAKYSNTGTRLFSSATAPLTYASALATDYNGNAWYTGNATQSGTGLSEVDPAGTFISSVPPSVQSTGSALAVDAYGTVWLSVTSSGGHLAQVNRDNVLLSPAGGYTLPFGYPVNALAVDGSGDIWIINGRSQVVELIGSAAPVVTPLSARGAVGLPSDHRP